MMMSSVESFEPRPAATTGIAVSAGLVCLVSLLLFFLLKRVSVVMIPARYKKAAYIGTFVLLAFVLWLYAI